MTDIPVVEGTWPGRLEITRGWGRAVARPWNDDTTAAQIRMVRGSADFLDVATSLVGRAGGDPTYSPALYPSATRVWARAGYQMAGRLMVMERSLSVPWPHPHSRVDQTSNDWDALVALDRAAFEGFWRMGRFGLEEAYRATGRSMILTVGENGPVGYAIVGAQRGVGYLQRIAVSPRAGGQGLGTDLVHSALAWARARGARTMLLNVREEASPARRLYHATGFHDTGTRLAIMGRGTG